MIKRTNKDFILLILKGAAMGLANKIPGVSGGIVALITGFYQELIETFKSFNINSLLLLRNGRINDFFKATNSKFLICIFSGVIFSFFSVSLILDYYMINFEKQVLGLFFGMILSSVYFIIKKISSYYQLKNIAITILGFVFGFSIILIDPGIERKSLLFIVLCGFISISGMTLPGLSGSYLLLIIGNYKLILVDSVNNLLFIIRDLLQLNFEFLNNNEKVFMLKVIVLFSLGSLIGLITLSNILSFLLRKYNDLTISLLSGFIIGTLPSIWPWKKIDESIINESDVNSNIFSNILLSKPYFPNQLNSENLYILLFIFFGILIIVILEKYGSKN